MAKIKGPLLSLSASGSFAKTMVYAAWKGIQYVRVHVIPANPRSPAQIIQRAFFTLSVADWHDAKYNPADIAAWDRYATTLSTAMSGFNAFVKGFVDFLVAAVAVVNNLYGASIFTGGAGLIAFSADEDGLATNVFCSWGYSPTDMHNTVTLAEGPADTWTLAGVAATVGATVYGRYWCFDAVGVAGRSGIHSFVVL